MVKTAKRRQKVQMPAAIRSKMMAAVSMLMVSVIMMVSSTYAWFTLSTAPEVTGITTNVGANGNLEMMLLSGTVKDNMTVATYYSTAANLGVESEIGDSMAAANADVLESNETWGNLVDLSSSSYGLGSIALSPAKLNATSVNDATSINVSPLLGPSYGSDGRVISVEKTTYVGKYASGTWTVDDNHAGVRAIGMSSGATVRLSAYSSALRSAKNDADTAKAKANQSLSDNAQALATLLVDKAQGATTFSNDYKDDLNNIITGVTAANEYVASAIKNATLAYCLSADNTEELTDEAVGTLSDSISAAEVSELDSIVTNLKLTMPSNITKAITEYNNIATDLKTATTNYASIENVTGDLSWEQVNNVLQPLVDQNYMTVNDAYVYNGEKEDIMDAVLGEPDSTGAYDLTGINVKIKMFELTDASTINGATLAAGDAGVYFKIAKICGQEPVSGKVNVNYNSVKASVPFTMSINVNNNNTYMILAISQINTAGAPETTVGGEGTTVTLNDPLGYMLDFGFRTNASGSNLLLQTEEAQRVYNSDTNTSTAESTQGGGSYMQFTTTNVGTFSIDEMCKLMSTIRVAFVQPVLDENGTASYTLLAMGALDCPTVDTDGTITYPTGSVSASVEGGSNDTLKLNLNLYNYKTTANSTTEGDTSVNISLGEKLSKQTITALTQNTAAKVSVIVYLDGELVDNTMVASSAQSMYGSLNLQFSSDATLVPMDNNGMFGGGAAIIDSSVTFEEITDESITVGGYTGTVKEGVTIYKGSDGEYYYSTNGGQKYLLTTSNYSYALNVTVSSSGTGSSSSGTETTTSMTLTPSANTVEVGKSITLKVENMSDGASISGYTIDSESSTGTAVINEVDGVVTVTGMSEGTVTIQATVTENEEAKLLTCSVTVVAATTETE